MRHLSQNRSNHPYYDTFLLRQKKLAAADIKLSISYNDKYEPDYFVLVPITDDVLMNITKTVNIEEIADIMSSIENYTVEERSPYSLHADTVEDLEKQ